MCYDRLRDVAQVAPLEGSEGRLGPSWAPPPDVVTEDDVDIYDAHDR
jgi:hypothetical protein